MVLDKHGMSTVMASLLMLERLGQDWAGLIGMIVEKPGSRRLLLDNFVSPAGKTLCS